MPAPIGNKNALGWIPSAETRSLWSKQRKGRRHTEEEKKKIGDSCKGHTCPEEKKNRISTSKKIYYKTHPHEWKGRRHSKESIDKIRMARRKQILPFKDTSIEIAIQTELRRRNVQFETHKEIFGQPDVFISPDLAVFCDGDYWHRRQYSEKRDSEVNLELIGKGYKVIRFWESEIRKNVSGCVDRIMQTSNGKA